MNSINPNIKKLFEYYSLKIVQNNVASSLFHLNIYKHLDRGPEEKRIKMGLS
jgi:hypothetical protein